MTSLIVNGHIYSTDGTGDRDLSNGGHQVWFLPLLADVITVVSGAVIGPESMVAAQTAAADALASESAAAASAADAALDAASASSALDSLISTLSTIQAAERRIKRDLFAAAGHAATATAAITDIDSAVNAAAASAVATFYSAVGIPLPSPAAAGQVLTVNQAGDAYEHSRPINLAKLFFMGNL